jgi:uncharacterized membrane protein YphA (DoxX/SURF4 family)
MKTALWGRVVFGASAVLFGVIALKWHDADTWQTLIRIWSLPFGTAIGDCLMIALIAGGVGLQLSRTARLASIVLIAVFSVFSLACVPGIIARPKVFQEYGSFFEQFSLLSGAIAVYAVTAANAVQSAKLGSVARIGLGFSAISFALDQAFYLRETASLVPKWIVPNQMFWAIFTTIAFALAAIAMLINVQARLASGLMTLMLAFFGVLVWMPLVAAHPQTHGVWSEFALTFLITGAAWVVADAVGEMNRARTNWMDPGANEVIRL